MRSSDLYLEYFTPDEIGSNQLTIFTIKIYNVIISVSCKSLANQLNTIQGQMVIVHYEQKQGALFWKGESEYIVSSVKPVH